MPKTSNWKTTTAGVITLVVAVLVAAKTALTGGSIDFIQLGTAVMGGLAGLGLIHAKDNNTTT